MGNDYFAVSEMFLILTKQSNFFNVSDSTIEKSATVLLILIKAEFEEFS